MVLDYYGLAGQPTDALATVAARNHVTPRTVSTHVQRVRAAASGLILPAELIEEGTRPSRPGEDHTARKRIAATLHLAVPAPSRRTVTRALVGDSDARAAAVTAGRVLAATGPLPLDVLIAAVARSRRSAATHPTRTRCRRRSPPCGSPPPTRTAPGMPPQRPEPPPGTGPSPRPRQAGTSPATT